MKHNQDSSIHSKTLYTIIPYLFKMEYSASLVNYTYPGDVLTDDYSKRLLHVMSDVKLQAYVY